MSGVRRVAPAALLLAGFVALWQGVATLDSVDDLTLASPVETWTALGDDWSLLIDNAWVTLAEVLLGLALSVLFGVVLAVTKGTTRPRASRRCSGSPGSAGVSGTRARAASSVRNGSGPISCTR